MPNIKLNAAEWNKLTADQQNKITAILQSTKLLGPGDRIVPDAGSPAIGMLAEGGPAIEPAFICKLLCGIAETAAIAACALLPPPVNAVCIAAAHAGGEVCRNQC